MSAIAPTNLHACPCCGAPVDPLAVLMDAERGLLTLGGITTHLTRAEFGVFSEVLKSFPGIATKEVIYENLYMMRPDCDWPEIKLIDVLVCKLRPKLAEIGLAIDTIWGRGYQLVPPGSAVASVTTLARRRKRRRA